MKAIIENGKVNNGVQSCFISQCGVEMVFYNNKLAYKFALTLNSFGISYIRDKNKVLIHLH